MTIDIDALAARCEREEASRELDIHIAERLGWWRINRRINGSVVGLFRGRTRTVPPYTTSIDAAVTLVPSTCCWQVQMDICYEPTALVYGHDIHKDCNGASPALALCAAALRARAALAGDGAPADPPKVRE